MIFRNKRYFRYLSIITLVSLCLALLIAGDSEAFRRKKRRGSLTGKAVGYLTKKAVEKCLDNNCVESAYQAYRNSRQEHEWSERELIAYAQQCLTLLGYEPGPVDGINGSKTTNAISKFQSDNNLDQTNMLDEQTLQAFQGRCDIDPASLQVDNTGQVSNAKYDQFRLESGQIVMKAWDKNKAKQIVMYLLEMSPPKSKNFGSANLNHNIIDYYHIEFGQYEKQYIAAIYSKPIGDTYDCHACAPVLSFIEFKMQGNDGWIMGSKHIGVLETGSWGEPPSMKFLKIGSVRWGLVVESGYTAQGESTTVTRIYSANLGKFSEIFSETTYEGNANNDENSDSYYELNSNIAVKPIIGAEFYDLILSKHETKGKNKTVSQVPYKFNGSKYFVANVR